MKQLVTCAAILFLGFDIIAQSVGIGDQKFVPAPSAALEIRTIDKGILIPRLTEDEKESINSPSDGLLIFQTDNISGFYYFRENSWHLLSDSFNNKDNDPDPQNEIQLLTLVENKLSITNGNTVEFDFPQLQDYQSLSLNFDTLRISQGNYVIIPEPDNLGSHKASQNIQTSGHYISSDGDNEGILISEDGAVSIFGNVNLGINAVQAYEIESNAITTSKIANGQVTYNKLGDDVPKGLSYKGTWNASTNNPNLSSSSGLNSDYYVVSEGGSINLGYGLVSFNEGDWIIYNGSDWVKVGNGNTKNNNNLINTSSAQISDIRLKENVRESQYGLNDLMKIRVVDFDYKEGTNNQTGMIAQELFLIYPAAVIEGNDNYHSDPWKINYSLLTPVLIKSTQELNSHIEELELKNNILEQQVDILLQRIEKLEKNSLSND